MVQACPAASGKVRYLKQQKSALDPILLVTKNDFLRLTPWGLEPSPCPCGHPKKAFLGWFVEHLLSLNTTNTGAYRPSGAGIADPPQTMLVPIGPMMQGLDGTRGNPQGCAESVGNT